MRQMSKRRQRERPTRALVVAQVLARDGGCVAAPLVPTVACSGPLDVHEVIPRSAWRAGYLELANTKCVCRAHHDWVGDHLLEAHDLGLHGWSWERPA